MAREWDYFSGIESMTHCMPRENRSAGRSLVFSIALTDIAREGPRRARGLVSASPRRPVRHAKRMREMRHDAGALDKLTVGKIKRS